MKVILKKKKPVGDESDVSRPVLTEKPKEKEETTNQQTEGKEEDGKHKHTKI